ncbi:hypothetical protein [Chamaesiphon sp. OTE_75_metabat_556]|uniref:hypothetical protein n=1 Tax=Chamaesiphon sp. OTE_75_metabat_556 TaxID=2964692 RepID=UPI00286BBB1C|nr:hypothetical protein [Chamaesiphon sp. OTE_75_metabat_556]
MYEEHQHDRDHVGGASPPEHCTPNRLAKFDRELGSGDLVARSIPDTFEQFLQPNGDEYCEPNCDYSGQIVRRSNSDRSQDELMKIAISLALTALELAEIELLDRLNAIYLEATSETAID